MEDKKQKSQKILDSITQTKSEDFKDEYTIKVRGGLGLVDKQLGKSHGTLLLLFFT